jgi:hypothetical protein
MFYVNPPVLNEIDLSMIPGDASTTASGFVAYEALRVLDLVASLGLTDVDKVVRTQPLMLLESSAEINRRINFLLNLFLEAPVRRTAWDDDQDRGKIGGVGDTWVNLLELDTDPVLTAQRQLCGLILTYPAILSIGYE